MTSVRPKQAGMFCPRPTVSSLGFDQDEVSESWQRTSLGVCGDAYDTTTTRELLTSSLT